MKIGGVYILSRRSIARMIATITAALMSLYAAVSAQAQNTVRRIHDAAIALHMLDRQMMGGVTRTVVPEIMYREYKALYLELRAADDGGVGRSRGTRVPTAEVDSPSHVGSASKHLFAIHYHLFVVVGSDPTSALAEDYEETRIAQTQPYAAIGIDPKSRNPHVVARANDGIPACPIGKHDFRR